jgi:predicted lipase
MDKKKTLQFCANLCILSYKNSVEHLTNILDVPMTCVQEILCNNARGLAVESEDTLYICWTGTNDLIDIYDNIQFPIKYPLIFQDKSYGYVHKGFHDYYQDLRAKTNDIIKDFIDKDGKNIVFTGHSLGACISISCLETILNYPFLNIQCITLGSPKIGDQDFVNAFDSFVKQSSRIVDEEDIITNIPIGFGYCHTKNEIVFKRESPISWIKFFWNIYHYVWERKLFAHSLLNYLNKLDEANI